MKDQRDNDIQVCKAAQEHHNSFFHYLLGWMGREHHAEMAECALYFLGEGKLPDGLAANDDEAQAALKEYFKNEKALQVCTEDA